MGEICIGICVGIDLAFWSEHLDGSFMDWMHGLDCINCMDGWDCINCIDGWMDGIGTV